MKIFFGIVVKKNRLHYEVYSEIRKWKGNVIIQSYRGNSLDSLFDSVYDRIIGIEEMSSDSTFVDLCEDIC